LPEKNVAEVTIGRTEERLFEQLEAVWKKGKVDIFWVEGLEQSLLGYEDMHRLAGWDEMDLITYSWKDVPPILSHLNLGRERFEARFDCAVVFVVPLFVVKYLLRRAGDFFDWKSGFFEFPDDWQTLAEQMIQDSNYVKYLTLSGTERLEKILQIKDLLNTEGIEIDRKASLLRELGQLFYTGKNYEQALLSFDQAIKLTPTFSEVWDSRGNSMRALGRYSEAIIAYQRAIELNPQDAISYVSLGSVYFEQIKYQFPDGKFPKSQQAECIEQLCQGISSFKKANMLLPKHLEAEDSHINKSYALNRLLEGQYRLEELIKTTDGFLALVKANNNFTVDRMAPNGDR
jgi:tetratricopeptide (TPR) repeat protein